MFGCVAREHFFINLKTKSTGRLVDAIVKTALGATCSSTPMEIQRAGEKFVPAKCTRKRSRRRGVKATIERIGEHMFKGSDGGQAFLLSRDGEIDTYVYDSVNGLVLDTEIRDEPPSTGRLRLVSTRTESIEVDVGCEVAANLAVREEVGIPLPIPDLEPTDTAAPGSSSRPALVSGSSSSSVGEDSTETMTSATPSTASTPSIASTPSSVVSGAVRSRTFVTTCTTGVEEQGVGVHAQAASRILSPRRQAHPSKVSSHGLLPP